MIDSELLAVIEHRCKQGRKEGRNIDEPWGGTPFVILVGDDYQLPPIKPGAFYTFETGKAKTALQKLGENLFLDLSKNVTSLKTSKRQDKSEQ